MSATALATPTRTRVDSSPRSSDRPSDRVGAAAETRRGPVFYLPDAFSAAALQCAGPWGQVVLNAILAAIGTGRCRADGSVDLTNCQLAEMLGEAMAPKDRRNPDAAAPRMLGTVKRAIAGLAEGRVIYIRHDRIKGRPRRFISVAVREGSELRAPAGFEAEPTTHRLAWPGPRATRGPHTRATGGPLLDDSPNDYSVGGQAPAVEAAPNQTPEVAADSGSGTPSPRAPEVAPQAREVWAAWRTTFPEAFGPNVRPTRGRADHQAIVRRLEAGETVEVLVEAARFFMFDLAGRDRGEVATPTVCFGSQYDRRWRGPAVAKVRARQEEADQERRRLRAVALDIERQEAEQEVAATPEELRRAAMRMRRMALAGAAS